MSVRVGKQNLSRRSQFDIMRLVVAPFMCACVEGGGGLGLFCPGLVI